jgi:XTP/dITP diphosphohydrolase
VLAGQEISLEDQVAQWHERKALEKASRNSIMDDLSTAQPALALASKVLQRVTRAGLPAELIPDAITAVTITADGDVENRLRTAILEFMDTVRAVEEAIAAARGGGVDVLDDPAPLGEISEAEWRTHWPQL